jgi:Skp family chaperone for outer membrane proteins
MISRKTFALALWLLGTSLALSGCNKDDGGAKSDGGGERVGVVNILKVEEDLYWNHEIDATANECAVDLRRQYDELVRRADIDLAEKMKQYGVKEGENLSKLTSAQQKDLVQASTFAHNVRTQGPSTAQNIHNAYRAALERQYRLALDPIIEEIAKEKKMSIVISQADAALYSHPSVDISKAVAQAARFKPPAIAKPAFPKIPFVETPSNIGGVPIAPASGPTTKP